MLSTPAVSTVPCLLPLPQSGTADTGFTVSVASGGLLPFTVARAYWIYHTPSHTQRGHHAHHTLQQLLVAVGGRLEITLETTTGEQQHFVLDRPDVGLYLPGLYWRTVRFQEQAVLLCLVSEPYSEASYIRDYATFRALAPARNPLAGRV